MRPRASLAATWVRDGHLRRALLLAALSVGSTVTAAEASPAQQPFKLSSSLDGKSVLPHRIHWTASIGLTPAQLGSFAFQIDGKTRWIGNKLPAVYADGNGYLVTSWLTREDTPSPSAPEQEMAESQPTPWPHGHCLPRTRRRPSSEPGDAP
jgi:hypothetical protein